MVKLSLSQLVSSSVVASALVLGSCDVGSSSHSSDAVSLSPPASSSRDRFLGPWSIKRVVSHHKGFESEKMSVPSSYIGFSYWSFHNGRARWFEMRNPDNPSSDIITLVDLPIQEQEVRDGVLYLKVLERNVLHPYSIELGDGDRAVFVNGDKTKLNASYDEYFLVRKKN